MRKLIICLLVVVPCLLWGQTIQNLAPFVLVVPTVASNPVTFDASTSGNTNGNNPDTMSLTIANQSNRLLLIWVSVGNSAGIDSITCGTGNKATFVDSVGFKTTWTSYLYKLVAPPTGVQKVIVYSLGQWEKTSIAASFYNVNQTTPLGAVVKSGQFVDVTTTISVTSATNNLLAGECIVWDNQFTAQAPSTSQQTTASHTAGYHGMGTRAGSAGSVSMNWTGSLATGESMLVDIKQP